MKKVILFDLDNTLIDRQRVFRAMLKDKIGEFHKDSSEAELNQIIDQIMKWDNRGNLDRLKVFEKYVEAYHPGESAECINDYWHKHSGEIVIVFDDAQQTLEYLKQKYRLGIISNGNTESQRRKISRLPFLDLFEYTIVSGELGIHKPDPRIFLKACEEMQVKPEECIYIGDNFRCDIEGAKAAGILPIWVCPKEMELKEYTCIQHLAELKQLL